MNSSESDKNSPNLDTSNTNNEEFSFRSRDEYEYERRSRSKQRKKNKHVPRNNSGSRRKNNNCTKHDFCRYCNPTLAIRIHNKYLAENEAKDISSD
jgi:ribosome assembly protein YihI (activator of Der GTPase)